MSDNKQYTSQQLAELLEMVGSLVLKSGSTLSSFKTEILGDLDERLDEIAQSVGEEGIDPFGMSPSALRRAAIGIAFLYKVYFRCDTSGLENIPKGPVILVANHAGQLPIDGVMISSAVLMDGSPPRLVRSMMDRWVPNLPFVSTAYARLGVTVGTPENAELLLNRKEVLLTFPEGMPGITKTVDQAYHLQEFGPGFMRLALTSGAPIVPVAVVGSEEQYPTLYNLKGLGKLLGLPALPIWAQMIIPVVGMLPLPVKYRIQFGEPMQFKGDPDDEDAIIQTKVEQVKERLGKLLKNKRNERKNIFW